MNTPTGRTPDSDASRRETDDLRARLDAEDRAALDLLADAAKPDTTPPLRLDADRRERLLATLRTHAGSAPAHGRDDPPDTEEDNRIIRFTRVFRAISREYGLVQVAAMLVVMMMLAALSLAPFFWQKTSRVYYSKKGDVEVFATGAGGGAGEDHAKHFADKLAALPAPSAAAESSFEYNTAAEAGEMRAKHFEHKLKSRANTAHHASAFAPPSIADPIPEVEERADIVAQTESDGKSDAPPPSFDAGLTSGGLAKGSGGGTGGAEATGIDIGKAGGRTVRQSTGRIVAKNEAAAIALPSAPAPQTAAFASGKKATLAKESSNSRVADDPLANEKDSTPATPAKAPARLVANREVDVSENAFSTFSLNVSDASFRMAVAANAAGRAPAPATQRAEEFVNSQVYPDPQPRDGEAFGLRMENASHPFAPNRQIVRVSLRAAATGRAPSSPLNLVVALDNSGSMERADRRETVAAALNALADKLGPRDTVSVLNFARTQNLVVDRARGAEAAAALRRVAASNGTPEGGTNLEAALAAGFAQLAARPAPDAANRLILLTDGATNLGEGEPEKLAAIVEANRKGGRALDCFGIGLDGYDDAMLERLARHGDGRYAFLNNADAVRDGFAEKIAGALRPAARDVKVQVEFNPDRVASWRLIGYDKHRLTKEQFRDNTVDAAELAAAETGTAVYVIEPRPDGRGDLGVARVRYLDPATREYREESRTLPYRDAPPFDAAPRGVRLAAVAALTGELYGDAPESATYDPDALAKAARRLAGETPADTRVQNLRELAEAAARNRR